jgi:hypothetical protein
MGSPFPAEWRVLPSGNFEDFSFLQSEPEGERTMVLMVQLDDQHRYAGHFRIRFVGGEPISIRVPLAHLLPNLPAHMRFFYLDFAGDSDDVSPPRDLTATNWLDVADLVKSRVVFLTNANKEVVDPTEFLQLLQSSMSEKEPIGAAVRWAVDVDKHGKLRLQLQALPTPAQFLTKSHLHGDNTVSVSLGDYDVNVDVFNDPTITGPVPVFFSDNPEAAVAYLTDHPVTTREAIATVNSRFLRHESMTVPEAFHYLKKSRRAAKGTPAFPPIRPSAAKRKKTTDTTETGRFCLLLFYHI